MIPNIKDFFDVCFDEDIEIRDPLNKISVRGHKPKSNFILYANVIGLALRGLAKDPQYSGINLLSKGEGF